MRFPGSPKVIGIASSPNTSAKDNWLALRLLLAPWRYQTGPWIERLEGKFRALLGVGYVVSFESGRTALYELLRSLGIGPGDEVVIQAYTCVVVPDAVLWAGARPIYADIGSDYNIDPSKLVAKVSPRTKAVVVQHTFGYPAKLAEIERLVRGSGIKIIEDCAHLLGTEVEGKKLGTWGDAAFFSFGQEKAISSGKGGLAVTNDENLGQALLTVQSRLLYPSGFMIVKRLLHPLLWSAGNALYYFFNLGKAMLWLSIKLGLSEFLVSTLELAGQSPSYFPRKLANAQAAQATAQLERADRFNEQRIEAAKIYSQELGATTLKLPPQAVGAALLRYTIGRVEPLKLRSFAKKKHIILGNWYDHPVYPVGADLAAVKYEMGSCPVAEEAAKQSVNLPTSPTLTREDLLRVVAMVKEYLAIHG